MTSQQPAPARWSQVTGKDNLDSETDAGDVTLSYVVADADGVLTAPYQPSDATTDVAFFAGLTINQRYVLQEEIGRGGMGQVFLGRDLRLERPVAIKAMLPPNRTSTTGEQEWLEEAFIKEAKLGANLVHPAIATVYDFGVHHAKLYTVFEYVPGQSLRHMLRQSRVVPLDDVRLIIGPLAQALDYAHMNGIVHRDLKPENIKATDQGAHKILDLGLAKEFHRTSEWRFSGTPAYAAPEQVSEKPSDGRVDQYALGLIVYEMLTGRRPFISTDLMALLQMHCSQPPPDPREFAPSLPESVCAAILRSLKKDPNERFPTCQEFASALGCRMLSSMASVPQILSEATVEVNPPRLGFAPSRHMLRGQLLLTPDAFWLLHREEIKVLPIAHITNAHRHGRRVQVWFRSGRETGQYRFKFVSKRESAHWHAILSDLICAKPTISAGEKEGSSRDPVVLLRRPPNVAYQILGSVEAEGRKRSSIEGALRLRGALLDADAVVDVQEERLSRFGATTRRLTGIAVKSVNQTGKLELRSRTFCEQARQLGSWMIFVILAMLVLACLVPALFVGVEIQLSRARDVAVSDIAVSVSRTVAVLAGTWALTFVWPLLIAVMVRTLQWPQLLRPAAITFFAMATAGIIGAVSGLLSGGLTGYWLSGLIRAALFFDPGNLATFVLCLFLGRRSWNLYRSHEALIPDIQRHVDRWRASLGSVTLGGTCLFTMVLWSIHGYGGYQWVHTFNLDQFRALAGSLLRSDERVDFNNGGVVFYSSGATRSDAQAAGELLTEIGFFGKSAAHVHISGVRDRFTVKFVVQDGAWNRPEIVADFQTIGSFLAQSSFGVPLQVELCDLRLVTKKALTIDVIDAILSPETLASTLEIDIEKSEQLLKAQPNDRATMRNLAANLTALAHLRLGNGKTAERVSMLRRAVEIQTDLLAENPGDSALRSLLASNQNAIAWILATHSDARMRDGQEAVIRAEKACQLADWNNFAYLDTLAAANAEIGAFEAAIKYQLKAIEILPDNSFKSDLEKRLELYQSQQPFRESSKDTTAN